jgi:hypothetical protein
MKVVMPVPWMLRELGQYLGIGVSGGAASKMSEAKLMEIADKLARLSGPDYTALKKKFKKPSRNFKTNIARVKAENMANVRKREKESKELRKQDELIQSRSGQHHGVGISAETSGTPAANNIISQKEYKGGTPTVSVARTVGDAVLPDFYQAQFRDNKPIKKQSGAKIRGGLKLDADDFSTGLDNITGGGFEQSMGAGMGGMGRGGSMGKSKGGTFGTKKIEQEDPNILSKWSAKHSLAGKQGMDIKRPKGPSNIDLTEIFNNFNNLDSFMHKPLSYNYSVYPYDTDNMGVGEATGIKSQKPNDPWGVQTGRAKTYASREPQRGLAGAGYVTVGKTKRR